jgi:glycosyltransferase involved in cell wall biosynthesis
MTVAGDGWRPGAGGSDEPVAAPPGVRVVMDLRPLQAPERAPLTAGYLDQLLTALDADPREGESFAFLLALDLDDPTGRWANLDVIGRRLLPPTRLLRSGALTVDPFLLRGASIGSGWRAERGGAAGSVYHAAAGALPIASGIPIVASLLDLAPWQLPESWQRGRAAKFGQRLRAQLLKDAAAVIVPSRAAGADARRLLRVRQGVLRVVALAPRAAFGPPATDAAAAERRRLGIVERERLGLGARYAVYEGRFDARHDLDTLLAALAALAAEGSPAGVPDEAWPPRIAVVGASPDDRAEIARAAARAGVGEALVYAQALDDDRQAALTAGSRFLVHPVRSDAAGTAATEALASGVPVVASAVGALPEVVGPAGILVEPGDPRRLAVALRAAWSDDALVAGLRAAAALRPAATRTWADVASETRAVWAGAARRAPML